MVVLFYKILLLIIFIPPASDVATIKNNDAALHPFYVSVTEITHNKNDKSLEITCKIFIDDMEETLKKNFRTIVDLSDNKQQAKNDKLITDYIRKNLNIAADKKSLQLNYVGYEKDSEAVFCYFEVVNVTSVKALEVSNSILQDLTDKQINIMHVTVNGNRKSYKLDYPQTIAKFAF